MHTVRSWRQAAHDVLRSRIPENNWDLTVLYCTELYADAHCTLMVAGGARRAAGPHPGKQLGPYCTVLYCTELYADAHCTLMVAGGAR
eukprot:1195941-Prorocentrum_minimum.AAC.1